MILFKHKNKYLLTQSSTIIPLDNTEVTNKTIANPSAIQNHISDFLKNNKLRKPSTILCLPIATATTNSIRNLVILQATLCLSKVKLKLNTIVSQSLLQKDTANIPEKVPIKQLTQQRDLLEPFNKYNKNSPALWIASSAATLLLLIFMLLNIQYDATITKQPLERKHEQLSCKLKKLEQRVKSMHKMHQETSSYHAKVNTINRFKQNHKNPSNLLATIAQTIPQDSWLTNLKVGNLKDNFKQTKPEKNNQQKLKPTTNKTKNETNEKFLDLNIEGITLNPQSVTAFIKKLSEQQQIRYLTLDYLRIKDKTKGNKVSIKKRKKQSTKLTFSITGQINA